MDDDRQPEPEDYFECLGVDVTNTGLGEATRRIKAGNEATAFSFPGGVIEFGRSPLPVDHGIAEDRRGTYEVENLWALDSLATSAMNAGVEPTNWQQLVVAARERFPRLHIPNSLYENSVLAKEPFEAPIRDRAMALFKHLDDYMAGRMPDGSEGPNARAIVDQFFTGDRALFSGESPTNKRTFKQEMTFPDPDDASKEIFAHWHGKISHRYFRLHFEWPVAVDATRLKILYLGPKITKD
ncbi:MULTISPECIES: hypothetical protein [Cupriavidus]|uniref:hypothetical protein n=1 Tax=Cupriavidus TaxID=106589 RepID=UPI0011AE307D|nr:MULTISPECIES: hypothetical protein [Cupriavidus]MCO4865705.1 hypothetical protein [Cupriavidus sp. WGlv3]MCO4893471.1 hypothetical protein [Cupriavidus sp. WGtm5]